MPTLSSCCGNPSSAPIAFKRKRAAAPTPRRVEMVLQSKSLVRASYWFPDAIGAAAALAMTLAVSVASPSGVRAQAVESGAIVVYKGGHTVVVERFTRSGNTLTATL